LLANIYTVKDTQPTNCGVLFDDPMDDIINSFREIAFRMSIDEAANVDGNNTTVSQAVQYQSHSSRVEYAVDFRMLAVAVVISLLGPVATISIFWGWWNLGRQFSMSPLELAIAFQGVPSNSEVSHETVGGVLTRYSGNSPVEVMARVVRNGTENTPPDPDVQYGVVEDPNRLAIGIVGSGDIRTPRKGEVF
jgi:hypothetical protein